jgi:tight adherence protein B
VWFAYAETLRSDDLRLVAAAWTLCDTLGSPLAPTVATVSDVVRRRQAVRHRIAAALAGPRATMRVLTALPLSGPFVALAVGVSPGDLYTETAGDLSLAVGLVMLLLGRLWASRMIRAVTMEPRGPERRGARGPRLWTPPQRSGAS